MYGDYMKPNSDKNNQVILKNLPDKHRDKIRELLLDGNRDSKNYTGELIHTYQNIAYQCDVSIAAVRAVAATIKPELQERTLQIEGEVKELALSGAKMAMAQLVERLQAGEVETKNLPVVAGILTDKYIALKGADKQTAAVAIIGDAGEIAQSIIATLQRAAERAQAVDAEVIETT